MTRPPVTIRLVLYFGSNVVGDRLRRADPWPPLSIDFPDTAQGRKDAEIARDAYQDYLAKNWKGVK